MIFFHLNSSLKFDHEKFYEQLLPNYRVFKSEVEGSYFMYTTMRRESQYEGTRVFISVNLGRIIKKDTSIFQVLGSFNYDK